MDNRKQKGGFFTDIFLTFLKTFCAGGLICVAGQILIDRTKLTPARILVGFVVLGVFLSAVGIYEPFAQWAGCGATVPLTGFGNVLVQGTKEKIDEMGWMGILTGPLSSGAVGITAAMLSGFVISLIAKPKSK